MTGRFCYLDIRTDTKAFELGTGLGTSNCYCDKNEDCLHGSLLLLVAWTNFLPIRQLDNGLVGFCDKLRPGARYWMPVTGYWMLDFLKIMDEKKNSWLVQFAFLQLLFAYNSYIQSQFKFNKMEEYALIMRHEDGRKVASPEQIQAWMKQTMDWIGGIAAQNKFVGGTGLAFEEARVVMNKDSKKLVTNGPFGEIKETIGGFITVKA